ncbi:MAG: hypothetical protein M3Y74_23400, partial [Chloroflexota bacterium]|nr:hypothetical protein [Chloroflexota bacterium]
LCLTFLYYGLERPRLLPLAFVFGALGMYTYQPGRIFFPLLCLAWLIIYAGPLWRRWRSSLVGIVAGAIILIPTVLSILDGTFFARLNQLNGPPRSFGDQLATFWTNYLAHFQSSFLFDTSTDIILRHYVRGFGMLYGITAPFLVLGVLVMIVRHRRADLLFLAWFLVYPIAAALVGPPISTRSITGVIVFCIAIGQGLYTAGQGLAWLAMRVTAAPTYRRALVGTAAALALIIGLGATAQFMNAYLVDYPTYSSQWWGWQSGFKQITARFEQEHTHYAALLVDSKANAPDELMRFYEQNDPATCPNCRITDIMNPALVQQDYVKSERELWAVPSDDYPIATAFQALKGRMVGRLTIPGGATSWYFIATGPGA